MLCSAICWKHSQEGRTEAGAERVVFVPALPRKRHMLPSLRGLGKAVLKSVTCTLWYLIFPHKHLGEEAAPGASLHHMWMANTAPLERGHRKSSKISSPFLNKTSVCFEEFPFTLYFWKWKMKAKWLHGIWKNTRLPWPRRRDLPLWPAPTLWVPSSSRDSLCLHGRASRWAWQSACNQCRY